MMTRLELIACLAARGIVVNVRTLCYWEQIGETPKPIRRRHDGATRALYESDDWVRIARYIGDDPYRAAKYSQDGRPQRETVTERLQHLEERVAALEAEIASIPR